MSTRLKLVNFLAGAKFTIRILSETKDPELIRFIEDTLVEADRRQVSARLEMAAEIGPPRNEEQCRELADKIFELKPRNVRIFSRTNHPALAREDEEGCADQRRSEASEALARALSPGRGRRTMKTEERVRARLETYKRDPDYQAERLSIYITAEIVRLMESKGVSRTELAARMGVSKALISRLLGGTPNMTLRTLAAIAVALESDVSFELREWSDSVPPTRTVPKTIESPKAPRAMQIADKPMTKFRSRESHAPKRSRS